VFEAWQAFGKMQEELAQGHAGAKDLPLKAEPIQGAAEGSERVEEGELRIGIYGIYGGRQLCQLAGGELIDEPRGEGGPGELWEEVWRQTTEFGGGLVPDDDIWLGFQKREDTSEIEHGVSEHSEPEWVT